MPESAFNKVSKRGEKIFGARLVFPRHFLSWGVFVPHDVSHYHFSFGLFRPIPELAGNNEHTLVPFIKGKCEIVLTALSMELGLTNDTQTNIGLATTQSTLSWTYKNEVKGQSNKGGNSTALGHVQKESESLGDGTLPSFTDDLVGNKSTNAKQVGEKCGVAEQSVSDSTSEQSNLAVQLAAQKQRLKHRGFGRSVSTPLDETALSKPSRSTQRKVNLNRSASSPMEPLGLTVIKELAEILHDRIPMFAPDLALPTQELKQSHERREESLANQLLAQRSRLVKPKLLRSCSVPADSVVHPMQPPVRELVAKLENMLVFPAPVSALSRTNTEPLTNIERKENCPPESEAEKYNDARVFQRSQSAPVDFTTNLKIQVAKRSRKVVDTTTSDADKTSQTNSSGMPPSSWNKDLDVTFCDDENAGSLSKEERPCPFDESFPSSKWLDWSDHTADPLIPPVPRAPSDGSLPLHQQPRSNPSVENHRPIKNAVSSQPFNEEDGMDTMPKEYPVLPSTRENTRAQCHPTTVVSQRNCTPNQPSSAAKDNVSFLNYNPPVHVKRKVCSFFRYHPPLGSSDQMDGSVS